MIRCIEVRLSIPDNEARTALATLTRLGIRLGGLERADLYRCDVDESVARDLTNEIRACEVIFNASKHTLRERAGDAPAAGEVWIDGIGTLERVEAPVVVSGRTLAGVRSLERFTAWRLAGDDGAPASPGVVAAATTALLCNTAFQKARFEEPAR